QKEKSTAEAAATALSAIGAPAVESLTGAAGDDSAEVRALAVGALEKIGSPAVTNLVDLLSSKHVDVRRKVANVLGHMPINDKMVIIGLGFATRDKDNQARHNALQGLRNRGTGAKLAEPYISALLIDNDPDIRRDAFLTLQNLGVDPKPGLKKALSHADA